jgi:clan AA aspartic protease
MGEVRTEITLINIEDQGVANRGYMPQEQVRWLTVNAVVDTGAWTLVMGEETCAKLGLKMKEDREVTLAGGVKVPSRMTEFVWIRWKDRNFACEAVVIPGEREVLLGALPLEGMDLMIHPKTNKVIGAHGDTIQIVVKQLGQGESYGRSTNRNYPDKRQG